MDYRRLGASGLQVSVLALGTNMFGTDLDVDGAVSVLAAFVDAGGNLVDTADIYPPYRPEVGTSEQILGEALRRMGVRQQVLVATKVFGKMGPGPNDRGASRQHIMAGVDESLRRLQIETIDLLQLHNPDPGVPIEETLQALDDLVRAGKVRYVGCSNYAAWQVTEAACMAKSQGLTAYVSMQYEWNLLSRSVEREHVPACRAYGVGLLPYWPLAAGLLTGKYQPSAPRPSDARGAKRPFEIDGWITESTFDTLGKLHALASERDHSLTDLALGWLAAKPGVSAVICGASRADQVSANVKSIAWRLTDDEVRTVDELTQASLHAPLQD